jgi:3D (Asp-Asp-Asp) domain-containing protein
MKRYTITENTISFLLGGVIAVFICFYAYRDKLPVEPSEAEPVSVASIENLEPPTAESVEVIESSEEWVDGGYNDRVYIGDFTVTAYCPCEKCCGAWADGLTYTETIATEGRTIAVDPEVIPLGSLVEINGTNYVAEDIGGAVDGNHVDIFFNSHADALEFGKQSLPVYMVEECLDNFFN